MAFSTKPQTLDARSKQQPQQKNSWGSILGQAAGGVLGGILGNSASTVGSNFGNAASNYFGLGSSTGSSNPFSFMSGMGFGNTGMGNGVGGGANPLNPFQSLSNPQGGAGSQGGDSDGTFYSQTTQNAVESLQPESIYDYYDQLLSAQDPTTQWAFYDAVTSIMS